ncbi:MAG: M23 family metallopeptidase [Reyranella sp.]|uniref:M23 family metallopeptidase n=1 Tax=Reyranella sp. TaxID=1929291 RepID=UPI000A45CB91|nr:M23 family metallopeptidase [Reyranella sp.]MBR2814548.1 M23 family metallopeptidase [Reyranella sp.]
MKRPSVAAALVALLFVGAIPVGTACAQAPVPARLLTGMLLSDHLQFMRLASIDSLLTRALAVEIEPEDVQPLIAIADPVPPPETSGPVSEEVLAYGRREEDRLLGDGKDEERQQAYLPFKRQRGINGVVVGSSLADSAAAAGVPAPAMIDALEALALAVDLDNALRDGDKFYVRYEQTFTADGAPLDVGRVMWMELRTAKGTVSIHRFHMRDNSERFWMASGQAASPPSVRLPLDTISISSGFGLRADPFDQPPVLFAGKPQAVGGPLRDRPALPPGLPTGGALGSSRVNVATPLGASLGLSAHAGAKPAVPILVPSVRGVGRSLFMHEGVDLVAPAGTPVHAAADGVVIGAAPNGRYGNWIRIDHGGSLNTVYGHLAGFAPGLQPGKIVSKGDLIGFVGSTGRSTGAHLHFELLTDGKPVNPITHPDLKRAQLRGPDLEKFRKQVNQSLAERDREAKAIVSVAD